MDSILGVLWNCFQPGMLFMVFIGVAGGIIIGAIPGLTPAMAIAIMTSFTFSMDPHAAMALMIGVFFGGIYGGGIGSILVNIPGTPGAIMSGMDGHPMAKRGEAGQAIGIATWSSFVGGVFGMLMLILVAPLLSAFALRFSSPEIFALTIFGFSIVCSLCSRGGLAKGIVSVCLGIITCMVGLDPVTGVERFTFDLSDLTSGLQFVPVMIGLFGLTEILKQISLNELNYVPQKLTKVIPSFSLMKRLLPTQLRSSIIGTLVGAMPGAGASIAAFLSYDYEHRHSKTPELFGKGHPEGLAAPQAADNAMCGGAFMPMLTLGIPGDAVTALLLGALILHNIQPGPMLMVEHPSMVYTIYITGIMSDVFMCILGLFAANFFARLISVPYYFLFPIIMVMCVVGAFASGNSMFHVYVLIGYGILGFTMLKLGLPILPMVLGVVLGPMMEENLRTAILMSHGEIGFWFTRPITVALFAISLISVALPLVKRRLKCKTAAASA